MKTISTILIILLVILLVSCKKESQEASPPASFGFKTSTKDFSWNFEPDSHLEKGAMIKKTINPNTNNTAYVLDGWNNPDHVGIELYLNTPVLELATYKTVTALSDKFAQGLGYFNNIHFDVITNDYTSVTITNITGKYASGYFYAVMHDINSGSGIEMIFYDGYFNHILIQN